MEMENKKFCPAVWLSGFFGLGALVHLVRLMMNISVAVNGYEIPFVLSVVVVVFGGLSIGLLVVSGKYGGLPTP